MQIVSRLIKQFVPSNYQLSLSLDKSNRTFEGIVTIHGVSQPDADSIILHSKQLDIESITFDGKNAEYSYGDNDALIITHQDLQEGQHIIVIAFNGKITDSMHGLYSCYYEHDGVKKELLATQFESHHAREVFPCIDEPEAKATFDVTLTNEANVTVLGNMPIKAQTIENDRLVTTFETTPIMSSYLLAWVIGELHKKTAHTKSGVEVNVWATPAQPSDNLDFALDIATRSIDFFEEYFDTPYPLPKSDHVALPDFSAGAMENWGLVTYREIALLADSSTTSIAIKHHIALVVAHELSHQWFGNLVTMKWWNDLWLNESFASLVEYTAVNALEPSWDIWLDFASFESICALRRDSLSGVQPVQIDVNHPDEINSLFDGAIVYAKGARLLKMLERYIGEDAFRSGLKEYFRIHAYKSTEASDLWSALSNASGKDIAALMNAWLTQPGFPVLHVLKNDDQILLSQEKLVSRFSEKSDALWPIPLNSNCPELPKLLDVRSMNISGCNCDAPLRFNTSSDAHFITHYDHELLSQLVAQLKTDDLPIIDRLQLLHEQTIIANAGIISSAELIPLLDAFRNENTEAVWGIISMTICELKKFVEDDQNADLKLRSLANSLAQGQYARLGWVAEPSETEADARLRTIIIGLMLYSENPEAISSAINIFNSTPINELNPELRCLILSAAVRHSENNEIIGSLLETYKNTDSAELKQDISIGLTSTRKTEIITILLDMLKNTSIIRTQDTARWIAYLMRNRYAREQTWQWVRDNWSWIKDTFAGDKSYDDYPRYIATALLTRKQLDEYCSFFTPLRLEPALTRVIDVGISEIRDKVETIERDGSSVRDALLNL